MNKHITKIPTKYIKGEKQLESDKLLLLGILSQGRNVNNTTIFSVRYLCQRIDSSTGNTNRTKFLIDTLEYFEFNKILSFSDECTCENKINIREFNINNKIDISFGEFYDDINEERYTNCNNIEIKNMFLFCKNNKLNKYLMFHLYLYLLESLDINMEKNSYTHMSVNEIKSQLNISKDTFLKYMESFEELNIFNHKSTGMILRNGYQNVTVYYCRPNYKELLNREVNRIVNGSNVKIISRHIKKDNMDISNYDIYFEDLENLELKGLYLVRNLDNNMLKIGVANNLKSRINEIKSGFKFCGINPNIKVECFIETNHHYKLEKHLHNEFADSNYQNEWFDISDINIVLEKVREYIG